MFHVCPNFHQIKEVQGENWFMNTARERLEMRDNWKRVMTILDMLKKFWLQ